MVILRGVYYTYSSSNMTESIRRLFFFCKRRYERYGADKCNEGTYILSTFEMAQNNDWNSG